MPLAAVEVMCPKLPPTAVAGSPKLGWFSTLKNSARNSAFQRSVKLKSRIRLASQSAYWGPTTEPFLMLPYLSGEAGFAAVVGGLLVNAAGFRKPLHKPVTF